MLNHARTLLLNESHVAVEAAGGFKTDPTYERVLADGGAERVRSVLFDGSKDVVAKLAVVDAVMPFVLDPEFGAVFRLLDTRTTVPADSPVHGVPGSVSGFHFSMTGSMDVASRVMSSPVPAGLFTSAGVTYIDGGLSRMGALFHGGFEESKRFTALLYAVILRTEAARLRRAGRAAL